MIFIIMILTRWLSGPIRPSLERLDARGGKWGCHVAQLHGSSVECSVKELLTAGFSPEKKSERRDPKGDFILEAFLKETTISLFYGKWKHFPFSSEIPPHQSHSSSTSSRKTPGAGQPCWAESCLRSCSLSVLHPMGSSAAAPWAKL